MSHFYLTLPSNNSINYYPGNRREKYVTKLRSSISLEGEWEVGLTEIAFPRTWYTVDKQGTHFTIEKMKSAAGAIGYTLAEPSEIIDFRINSGYYDSVQDLLKEMNNMAGRQARASTNTLQKKGDELKFRYNEVNRKVIISMQERELITVSTTLATILGIVGTGIDNLSPMPFVYKRDRVCDINRGVTAIYVYCDILKYVPVGNTKAPLLHIVHADGPKRKIYLQSI